MAENCIAKRANFFVAFQSSVIWKSRCAIKELYIISLNIILLSVVLNVFCRQKLLLRETNENHPNGLSSQIGARCMFLINKMSKSSCRIGKRSEIKTPGYFDSSRRPLSGQYGYKDGLLIGG